MTEAIIGLIILIIIQIAAFGFWLGRLSQKVRNLQDTVDNHLAKDIWRIYEKLDMIVDRLSHIEGKLGKK